VRHPELLLSLPLLPCAHPHIYILKLICFEGQEFFGTLTTDC
jgi:hypothetical protein